MVHSGTVGSRIRYLRKYKLGYSQSQLADMLGVTRETVSRIECDVYKPAAEYIKRICDAAHVSIDYLINGTGEIDADAHAAETKRMKHYTAAAACDQFKTACESIGYRVSEEKDRFRFDHFSDGKSFYISKSKYTEMVEQYKMLLYSSQMTIAKALLFGR